MYIVCQSARTGRVLTIHDNRDQLIADMNTNTDVSENFINKFFKKDNNNNSVAK